MTLSEHVGVVYVATAFDGEVLYVGKSSLAEWRGWERCQGACERRCRALHRPCAHIVGRDRARRWHREILWATGGYRTRQVVPGALAYRYVLGKHRTDRLERATIARLQPRENVAHNRLRGVST